MFYLNTGLPGASKTLNTITTLVQRNDGKRTIYYHNIRLVMLDWEVVNSFSGWFYGYYLVHLKDKAKRKKLDKIIQRVHENDEFVTLQDVPFLEAAYENHPNIKTLLYWYRRLYSKAQLQPLEDLLSCYPNHDDITFELVEPFNLHFVYFENPREWHELPKRSVVLIDEVQQFFPQRTAGSKVPPAIGAIETHRHHGYDLYWITQDAMLIDVNARRLVGRHTNYFNSMGGKRLTKIESPKTFNPSDYFETKALEKKIIKHNKAFYGSYFSAEIHTHQFKLPKFVYAFIACITILLLSTLGVYSVLFSSDAEAEVVEEIETDKRQRNVTQDSKTEESNPIDVLSKQLGEMVSGVHITGTLTQFNKASVSYQYAFAKLESGQTFYPENVGLTVTSIHPCLAQMTLGDFSTYITCSPFTTSESADNKTQPVERGNRFTL